MARPRKASKLECPTCHRPIEWSEAYPYRPFCSERCRLIDLGAWLSGGRAIPGEQAAGEQPTGGQATGEQATDSTGDEDD